jgi:hypothetical protein
MNEKLLNNIDREIDNDDDPYSITAHLAYRVLTAGMRNLEGMNDHEFKILHKVREVLLSADPYITGD